jgi:hypothetical protein
MEPETFTSIVCVLIWIFGFIYAYFKSNPISAPPIEIHFCTQITRGKMCGGKISKYSFCCIKCNEFYAHGKSGQFVLKYSN